MHANLKEALALIARQPMIRTVEIADLVDMDPEMVQPMLMPYIDAAKITVIPVIAPNGRPANGFMFAEQFRATPEFRELFDGAAPASNEPAAAIVPASAASKAEASPAVDSGISKVETVIRFIRANGSASSQQLRELLKLGKGQYPMNYMGGAVRDGRLKVSGGIYTIGDGMQVVEEQQKSEPRKKQRKSATQEAVPAPPQAAEPTDPAFRCAMWSDGALELQRNGITIAILSDAEQSTIMKFRRDVIAAVTRGGV